MIRYVVISCLVCLLSSCSLFSGEPSMSITSPNGLIKVSCASDENGALNIGVWRLDGNKEILSASYKSAALLTSDSAKFNLVAVTTVKLISDEYDMVSGKRLHNTNAATEKVFTLVDNNGVEQNVIVRAYNDGCALRYELPKGGNVMGESTIIDMSASQNRWLQKYNQSYEDFYNPNSVDTAGIHYGFPSLFESSNGIFTLFTEADVHTHNSAASIWSKGNLHYAVAAQDNVGKADAGWLSPWRVAIIGKLNEVVESNLVFDVCEANKIEDTSWIKPGVASWIYWAYNHGSNDYQIIKQYVDMAYELKLPYVLIDAEWDEMGNGGNIEDALSYANEKGIRPLVWYNSTTAWLKEWGAPGPFYKLNKPEDREKEFAWLEEKGVAGVKVDFFDEDHEATMNYCIEILESAARHHLVVNFHGATIPRGWQRTYPNLVSTEAVYGAEWYNNKSTLTNKAAAHNATLPFTRGIIGSMDYTPCTFTDSQHPHITSDAHELALTVLFESAVLHLADRPSAYLSQPELIKNFLTNLPTAWDETKLVSGYPGKSVVLARRKANTWYVAGINGFDEEQTVSTDLSSIVNGQKQCTLIEDGEGTWNISEVAQLPAQLNLKPRGGFVAIIQ